MNNVLITICARSGSKRLIGKNLKSFSGKPLMEWTFDQARCWADETLTARTADIAICTDIAGIEFLWGQCVIDRPEKLNGDKVPKLEVIRYAAEKAEEHYGMKYDTVIDLDVTAPCRLPDDIEKAYQQFMKYKPSTLFSVVPSRRQPDFNQVKIQYDRVSLVSPMIKNVQFYDMNASIYIYNRKWLSKGINNPICRDSQLYVMQSWQAFDIDTQNDFDVCEFLFRKHILRRRK